jgi:hypothetical protein
LSALVRLKKKGDGMKKIIFCACMIIPAFAGQQYYWQTIEPVILEQQYLDDLEKPYDTSRDFPLLTYVQSPELLKKVLDQKIDKKNQTHQALLKRALRHAVMMDYYGSVAVLLAFGVPATAQSGDPINYVQSEKTVDLLVSYGAQVNRDTGLSTALFWALDGRHASAVKGLLKHGAQTEFVERGAHQISAAQWLEAQKEKAVRKGDEADLAQLQEIEKLLCS